MNLKLRRWWLLAGAAALLGLVAHFLSPDTEHNLSVANTRSTGRYFFRPTDRVNLSADPPRLAVVDQKRVDGRELVTFRLLAPKHRKVSAPGMGMIFFADGEGWALTPGAMPSWIEVRAGRSCEFIIPAPTQSVWTLRMSLQERRLPPMSELPMRVRACLNRRSLVFLTARPIIPAGLLESPQITNASAPHP